MRELVQKQRGEFDAQILQYQTREKEQEEASYQANLDRQRLWEEETKREQKESGKESRNGNGKQEARMGFLLGYQRF